MKKFIIYICVALFMLPFAGCEIHETWEDGRPELEHVYYVSVIKDYNRADDRIEFEVAANGGARWRYLSASAAPNPGTGPWHSTSENMTTSLIPFRFISERVRSYDAVTYFWITENGLSAGRDYSVHTENGSTLTPNAQGGYMLNWPQAKKGVQYVKIQRLSTTTGTINLNMLDRSRFTGASYDRDNLETLINNQTNDYLIRGLWFDWNTVIVAFR
jgi:hypothetical protein